MTVRGRNRRGGPLEDGDGLMSVDFGAMFRRQAEASSYRPRSAEEWNGRAVARSRREKGSDYVREFLARVDFDGVRTALDMGCGSGNLAIPLAERLEKVWACDFASEMLRLLKEAASEAGVEKKISARKLAWGDDWSRVPRADLVICSRAMDATDMQGALAKMCAKAKLRCCLTLHAGGFFIDGGLRAALGRPAPVPRPGYLYAVNMLAQMGYYAKVDFLETQGGLEYAGVEEFVGSVRWRVGELTRAEEGRVRRYAERLPRGEGGRIRHRHEFRWAFLAWETGGKWGKE